MNIPLLFKRMEILLSSDTTVLSYWLNWRFFLCATWVFTSILIALFMIWKYEGSIPSQSDKEMSRQERAWFLYGEEAWRTCVKQIHPIWLMIFRIFAFVLLLVAVTADVVLHGVSLFYYYTQWTFCLVTIYFGFASVLSIYGCFQHHKTCGEVVHHVGLDAEQGLYVPLTIVEADNAVRMDNGVHYQGKSYLQSAAFWGYVFQIMFQMTAGAVVITDSVYWLLMFPFLDIRDYQLNFLTYVAHSLNAVLLLGDTALNCLVLGGGVVASTLLQYFYVACGIQTLPVVQMVPSIISVFEVTWCSGTRFPCSEKVKDFSPGPTRKCNCIYEVYV